MKLPLILKVLLRKFIIRSYYDKDRYPKKCPVCDCELITSRVVDKIDYTICEEEYYCKDCEAPVAYWAYGAFDYLDDWVFTWDWYKEIRKRENETT